MKAAPRLSITRLQQTELVEFFEAERELQLALVAAWAVASLPPADQTPIPAVASLMAWTEVIRKFAPDGRADSLRNRLKWFTGLWVVRYGV